jgi:hypothetical protein
MSPADDLDLIPEPDEIHRRLAATARAQKLLRRLLRLSLNAQRERRVASTKQPGPTTTSRPETAHVG